MKRLSTTTQGIKGGNTKTTTIGYAMICMDGDKAISIDNYSGHGEFFRQRVNPVICIFESQNCIFEGTHEQLISKLK
jgi:hypothetical protein